MGGNRVRRRIHAGKERPPRRHQRLVGFQNHGELDQIVAPHPYQRSGTRLRRDLAAMRERVAKLAQRDQSIAGGQIECLFHVRETRVIEERILNCLQSACVCYPDQGRRRERVLTLQVLTPAGTAEP